MNEFKIMTIKHNIFENNDRQADLLRQYLQEKKVFFLNLMSSPGSGKTTTLLRTIESLKEEMRIGIMEADIDSDVDAHTISAAGVKVIQLHTGGMCHLDADMTKQGLSELGIDELDLVILENVGNLICTAEFDTGASVNIMILSVPEGDDKPLKYPLMFSVCNVLLVNKMDAAEFFNFNMDKLTDRVRKLNPDIRIIPISAKNGDGIREWADWIRTTVKSWKDGKSL